MTTTVSAKTDPNSCYFPRKLKKIKKISGSSFNTTGPSPNMRLPKNSISGPQSSPWLSLLHRFFVFCFLGRFRGGFSFFSFFESRGHFIPVMKTSFKFIFLINYYCLVVAQKPNPAFQYKSQKWMNHGDKSCLRS